ncbi:MAG: hypothetical protein U0W24_15290 [Bacteroidales bacterium]
MSVIQIQEDNSASKQGKAEKELKEPYTEKGLLATDERISEILTGIIMTLTFTCAFSVLKSDTTTVTDMLKGAFCSTIAWGLIDAEMYLFMTLINKEHKFTFLNYVRKSKDIEKVHKVIVDYIPPVIAGFMQPVEIEGIRKKIMNLPEPPSKHRLKYKDYRKAAGIFFLIFFSTLPIAIPFVLFDDIQVALRISNLIAILMLFACGWVLGKYAGRNQFTMGILTCLVGIMLVFITIVLGG